MHLGQETLISRQKLTKSKYRLFVQGWPIYALAAWSIGSFGWLQFFPLYQAGNFFYFFFYKEDDWQSSTRWWFSPYCQDFFLGQEWKSCLWFTATIPLICHECHGYTCVNFFWPVQIFTDLTRKIGIFDRFYAKKWRFSV